VAPDNRSPFPGPRSPTTNNQQPTTNPPFKGGATNNQQPTTNNQQIMISKDTLFAVSLFPYLGFLWFITRSGQMPRLALIGFYGTLVFVAVTIPAGIYAKVAYGEALANIDWLHGSAEVFLTLANILIVLGFRQAVKRLENSNQP
jgi:hypothetical protein